MSESGHYYVPESSYWPITGAIGLFLLAFGTATLLSGSGSGWLLMILGFSVVVIMIFGWFSDVVVESEKGLYNEQVDLSFRWCMIWFIFSEVMFFAAFFGALFYARTFSVPWLGGAGSGLATNEFLWPAFEATWPLLELPSSEGFDVPKATVPWNGIPLLNTAILISSGVTLTIAHHALIDGNRGKLIRWLAATVILGIIFLFFQVDEFGHAWTDLNLTMGSGIYGATFYMLTGFHGLHVTLGAIMLTVILFRSMSGHFEPKRHFAFEAVAWYWHFVDVVWIGLFIFVYWL